MNPNALLAVTTVLALTLIVTTASVLGPEGVWMKYLPAALLSVVGFLVLNRLVMIRRKRKPKALIQADQPITLILAMIFPLTMILSAGLPIIAPGGEYGLMIVMAGVFTGLTIQSAAAAKSEAEG